MAYSNDAGPYLRLTAVNRMLEAINQSYASALDTAGTSEVAVAEWILDDETRMACVRGYDNIIRDITATMNSSGEIAVDSAFGQGDSTYDSAISSAEAAEIVEVKGSGPDKRRTFAVLNGKVYDKDLNTTDLRQGTVHTGHASGAQGTGSTPSRATIWLTVHLNLSFENCSPRMQEVIIANACIRMIDRFMPDDDMRRRRWEERAAIAEASFGPEEPRQDSGRDRLGPVVPVQQLGQQGQ